MTVCLGWAAAGLGATHPARNNRASIVLPRVETKLRQKLRLSAAARGWQPRSQDECSEGARGARGVGPGRPQRLPPCSAPARSAVSVLSGKEQRTGFWNPLCQLTGAGAGRRLTDWDS